MLNRTARLASAIATAIAIACCSVALATTIKLARRYPLQKKFGHILSFDVGSDRSIVVADYDQLALSRFDSHGAFARSYSRAGRGYCDFSGPRAIAFSGQGVVAWDKRHQLLQFRPDGQCTTTNPMLNYEVFSGALLSDGKTFLGGGNLFEKGPQGQVCVFFKFDEATMAQPRCLTWLRDARFHLLYARQYVARRGTSAWFMEAYSPDLYTWNGGGIPARRSTLQLNLPPPDFPSDERTVRATRDRFFDFYVHHQTVEGIAAVSGGVVVAVRTPSGAAQRLQLRYFADGSPTASAETAVDVPTPVGAYPFHVRAGPSNEVYVLAAHGTWPDLQYEVLVYNVAN